MSTKIAIWYTAGFSLNQGDRAILTSVLQNLRVKFPGAELYVFSPDPEGTASWYGVKAIPMGPGTIREQLKLLGSMDLMLWGGGNMLQESSFFFLPYQMTRIAMALGTKTPAMVCGMGAGPFRTGFNRSLARSFCNRITLITVRDPKSKALLRDLGVVKTPIFTTADPAVTLDAVEPDEAAAALSEEGIHVDRKRPLVGFSVRRWFNYRYGFLPVSATVRLGLWPEGGRERYEAFLESMRKTADHLVEAYGARLMFVPMYLGKGQEDDITAGEIISRMKKPEEAYVVRTVHPSPVLKGIIGLSDMFIGVRMHSTILATGSLVPTIALHYATKGEEYFRRIGQSDRAIPIDEVDFEGLRAVADETWAGRREIRSSLAESMGRIQVQAKRTFDYAAEIIR